MAGLFGGREDKGTGPWKPQGPYIEGGMEQAKDAFLGDEDPSAKWAREERARRGMGGAGYEQDARDQLSGTLRGDYLYGGKGFDAALQAATNKIIPGVESRFAAGGRHGSGLAKTAEASAIGDAFAGLYGQERQNQMGALGRVPGQQAVDYNDINAVGASGDQRKRDIERYMRTIGGQYGQNEPGGGAMGGWGGALTGAASGASAGSTAGPWGAAAGGILGGLGGYYR